MTGRFRRRSGSLRLFFQPYAAGYGHGYEAAKKGLRLPVELRRTAYNPANMVLTPAGGAAYAAAETHEAEKDLLRALPPFGPHR